MDDFVYLLVPPRPDTAALIAREGYQWVKLDEPIAVAVDNPAGTLAEAERTLQRCPSAIWAWEAKRLALEVLGRDEEALALAQEGQPMPPGMTDRDLWGRLRAQILERYQLYSDAVNGRLRASEAR
jgi:hypothetical protein